MAKVKKWIETRTKKPESEYEEAKREFEMAIGRPFINIRIEIPKGFEDSRVQFLSLETDKDFLMEVEDLVKKRLVYEKRGIKRTS
ncbi:MAG: hypothetical protein NWE91_01835 [Candidatus Bathyarchaeota archaeon]|nr:hypothetical protein [Candidatus Bathyarchaeota archaeon]